MLRELTVKREMKRLDRLELPNGYNNEFARGAYFALAWAISKSDHAPSQLILDTLPRKRSASPQTKDETR